MVRCHLMTLTKSLRTNLEKDDVDTIAGYLITKLGIIPAKGEKLSVTLNNGMVLTQEE